MAPRIQDYDVMFLASTSCVFHDYSDYPHGMVISPLHQRLQAKKIAIVSSHRQRVSFAAVNVTHEVLHRKDYTSEEVEATWYDRKEMRYIKQKAKDEAKFWDLGAPANHEEMTICGLEGRTYDGALKKTKHRRDAYASVFSEIAFQKEVDYYDEDMIADAYFLYSEPCAVAAQIMGQRDEMVARRIHENQTIEVDSFGPSFCRTTFVEKLLDSTATNNKNHERSVATSSRSAVVIAAE
jgi:hypothetical protein